ncbi:MAG: hypothetical protein A2005_02255 [Desulfuromonadales bacterium GWC2_61_20]|nr:MAG: hypothetical protein A2005_02255 [Desulfuromonadales bacterium GWC2_61_20]HAD03438.1 hypothetical protein [Desulfuromonas sp.]
MLRHLLALSALLLFTLCACSKEETPVPPATAPATVPADAAEATAPGPPVRETFDGEPQLSLFPRTGSYRPEDDDKDGSSYWIAFIDHILRTSGMRPGAGRDGSKGWEIHGIKGLESVAFFAPLGVKPATTYRISFDFQGELPKGASAGLGALEFDKFLWIGDQFPKSLVEQHQTAHYPGVTLKGKNPWKSHAFTVTTSARGAMLHLILFRDGPMDRQKPVFFDNIVIEEAVAAATPPVTQKG